MKLFRSITLMLLFLTAVPITVVGFILIDSSVDTMKTLTWELQQERADHAGRAAEAFFDNIISDLDLLLSNFSVANMNLRQRQELLSFILQKRPEVDIIAFYDEHGKPLHNLLAFDSKRILPSELADHQAMVASVLVRGKPDLIDFSVPYDIRRPARPKLSIESRHETAVAMTVKLNAGDAAYLGMEFSLTPLQEIIARLRVGSRGNVLLIDSNGFLVADKSGVKSLAADNKNLIKQQQLSSFLAGILAPHGDSNAPAPRVSGARPVRMGNDRELLAAYSPLVRPQWLMVSVEPLDEAYVATRKMTWQVVSVVLVSLALALGLGVLFAFGITRPVGKCVSGALQIARGNFGTILDVKTRNEIGELAHTFNYMSRQLLYYDRENKDLVATLEHGYLETIRALANSIDAKDPYTRGHSVRVTNVALALGRKLGLDQERMRYLRFGGILHDIGKIGISEGILAKKGQLTEEEKKLVHNHPVLGEKIIEPIDFLAPVRELVLHHHEWYDGSGYPSGLEGEQIPLGARIINAADTYDAVTSERPYQKAVDNREAIEIIRRLRGRQIDPHICDILIGVIEERIADGELNPSEWEDEYTDPTG